MAQAAHRVSRVHARAQGGLCCLSTCREAAVVFVQDSRLGALLHGRCAACHLSATSDVIEVPWPIEVPHPDAEAMRAETELKAWRAKHIGAS